MCKKRKIYIFTITIFLACLLIGCNNKPFSGEIQEKEFLPAYSETVPTVMVICNGKTISTIIVPIIYSYPDRWRLTIRREDNGKLQNIYVTKNCYNSVKVNDWFTYDPEYCTLKEPVTKKRQE